MRVLLISPNRLTEPYPVYPLGLDYVAGALGGEHRVKIADMNEIGTWDSLGAAIRAFTPNVIGVSLRNIDNTDTTDTKEFIEDYKQVVQVARDNSNAVIVCGGSGFTIFPDQMIDLLDADYGVVGEGERFARLLSAIENQGKPDDIPGVIVRNGRTEMPKPWEEVPVRQFRGENTHLQYYLKRGGMLNLQTKRGCGFKCIYCSYPHIEGRGLRFVSPREVADTAWALQEAGAKYFYITDAVFNSDMSHSVAVAEAFIKKGITIPWGAFFTPRKPSAGFFEVMARAGLTHVEFGTEAMSENMLASYRKPFMLEHVFDAHISAVHAGLHVAHYFLLGGPGETEHTLAETFSNIEKLEKAVFFFFCGVRIYPHTELYDMAVEEGKISASQNLLPPVFYVADALENHDLSDDVRRQAKGRSNWVIGSGGAETARVTSRMYEHGYTGPLWEYLIR